MNPMTNIKNITKLGEIELRKTWSSSWHDKYKDSAWIYVGGLPFSLSEGDIITVFSQYGEISAINLVRDKDTGKSRGFCFVCYEDQRSTVLAVDNLNGTKVLERTIRVDHVEEYKMPKKKKDGEPPTDNTRFLDKNYTPLNPSLKREEEKPPVKDEKPERPAKEPKEDKKERKRHSKDKKSDREKKKKSKSKKRKRSRSSSSSSSD